ncbi:hypothetical protein [Streptomyces sp. NPDC001500]
MVDAEQVRDRGTERKRLQDGDLVNVGGGQRVRVGGRCDEGPAAAVRPERDGDPMAEAAVSEDAHGVARAVSDQRARGSDGGTGPDLRRTSLSAAPLAEQDERNG